MPLSAKMKDAAKKNIKSEKSMMKISPVASLASVKCIKSKVSRKEAKKAPAELLNMRFTRMNTRGIIAVAAITPKIRHPKGFIPKSRMPAAIINLASGGCVHS